MAEESKKLSTFIPRFGTFKYLVILFALCKNPAF